MIVFFAPTLAFTVLVTALTGVFWFLDEPAAYRTRILIPGRREPWRLPWPMNFIEALIFTSALALIMAGTLSVTTWLGIWLFEPSPWRLLPPVTAFVALKLLIPSILKTLAARKREEALRDAELAELGEEEEDSGQ